MELISSLRASGSISNPFDFFKKIDLNHDGHYSMEELLTSPSQIVLERSSLAKSFIHNLKNFLRAVTSKRVLREMVTEVKEVMSVFDLIVVIILIASHKKLLRMTYNWFHPNDMVDTGGAASTLPLPTHVMSSLGEINGDNIRPTAYQRSFIGSLEQPISYLVWFPPFLALIDVLNVLMANLRISFYHRGDMPRIVSLVYNSIMIGSLITKLKDWVLEKKRQREYSRKLLLIEQLQKTKSIKKDRMPTFERDYAKEAVTDEISSLICWVFISIFTMQAMSLELGVALGSLFALGGIWSASVVLALRSTMENAVGGVLLKLQDKLRVGEKINIPGTKEEGEVEAINYLFTKLRLDDDSVIDLPNVQFIQGEVVNWSRTPYRVFRSTVRLKGSDIRCLPVIVETLRAELAALDGVESEERDLIVAATGFAAGKIKLQVEARIVASTDEEIAAMQTAVVNTMGNVLERIRDAGEEREDCATLHS